MTVKTPLAIFCYNRPAHTDRLLAALSKCELLDECKVWIFSDAAKSVEQLRDVEAVREVLRNWAGKLDASVFENITNKGLAGSIHEGVTSLINEFGRVIVLEDDLVPSPDFLRFMLAVLNKYEHDARVFSVSGYSFPITTSGREDAYFLPIVSTWGWATWKRAWDFYDLEATEALESLSVPSFRRKFDLDGAYPYSEMLQNRIDGKNSSWGVLWYWSVFRQRGSVLYPQRSLIYNGGHDGSGVHCGKSNDPATVPVNEVLNTRISEPLKLPAQVEVKDKELQIIRQYLVKMQSPSGSGIKATARRVKNIRGVDNMVKSFVRRFIDPLLFKAINRAEWLRDLNQAEIFAAQFGPDVKVVRGASILNQNGKHGAITIGADSLIAGQLMTFWDAGEIHVGKSCYVGDGSRIWSQTSVIIGDNCLIAHFVDIHDTNSHPIDWAERRLDAEALIKSAPYRTPTQTISKPIVIEDDVWIGFKATILKGVRIGRGAIIAANSVVTRDVPAWSVVAGNPAAVIRTMNEGREAAVADLVN